MSSEPPQSSWSPIPGRIPIQLADDFAAYSLQREIEQTNLVFYAFALFAVGNLGTDLITGTSDFLILNTFFLFISLAAASFMRRVLDHRLLRIFVNIVAFLVCAALVLAKQRTAPDDWFVYFADVLVIAALSLTMPINLFLKVVYSLAIAGLDIHALSQSTFAAEIAAGVVLVLVATAAFSLIIYYKMQQAHFTAFLSLRKEQAMNEELRNAQTQINELQELLPVCANCKKVRDDNGYWEQIDRYIHDHLDVTVSHSMCPDCVDELYPELKQRNPK